MLYFQKAPKSATEGLFGKCRWEILQREADANAILHFLAANNVKVSFVQPSGLSAKFESHEDAGSVSIIGKHIGLDVRKEVSVLAQDLARYARILMEAPKPSRLERFLYHCAGATYGRFLKLEEKTASRLSGPAG